MSGGIGFFEAQAGSQQRPPVRGSTARPAAADAAASFGKAIDDALQDATRTLGATAEKPTEEVEETQAADALGGEPASGTAGQQADTPAAAGPPTPDQKSPPAEAGFMVRGNPVAQLLALIVVNGLAAAPDQAEASAAAAAPVEPGPPAPRRPVAVAAHPVVTVGARFDAGAGDAGAAREPLPVAVVASAAYPSPSQPVPGQLAAALAGEIGAVSDPALFSAARPQPPARLLTIALDPPELGSVLVRLKLTGRGLEVAVAAQPQAVSAVREGLGEIARALHGQGIPVEALNVRVADWRDLAAAVPATPRADMAAASPQASPQAPGGTDAGWSGRDGGDGRGERRDAPGDGAAHRPREQREGRENNGGENEALGRAGGGGGRYV